MTTDNFCFYLQNRLIQTSQTGGQWYSDTSHLVFPGSTIKTEEESFITPTKDNSKLATGSVFVAHVTNVLVPMLKKSLFSSPLTLIKLS